ncbi:MAG TPA: chemotaxis protein CheW [Acidobacteriaceae bacterium]
MRAEDLASAETTIHLCSVRAGEGLYGVDTRAIREVLGDAVPQRVPLAPHFMAGVLTYRGEVLVAVSLRTLLGLERRTGSHRVLVLEQDEGERFGLVVDSVGGMVSAAGSAFENNPATLDARGEAIFDGVYRTEMGLMVRLDPRRLRPTELAQSGIFEARARMEAR